MALARKTVAEVLPLPLSLKVTELGWISASSIDYQVNKEFYEMAAFYPVADNRTRAPQLDVAARVRNVTFASKSVFIRSRVDRWLTLRSISPHVKSVVRRAALGVQVPCKFLSVKCTNRSCVVGYENFSRARYTASNFR